MLDPGTRWQFLFYKVSNTGGPDSLDPGQSSRELEDYYQVRNHRGTKGSKDTYEYILLGFGNMVFTICIIVLCVRFKVGIKSTLLDTIREQD